MIIHLRSIENIRELAATVLASSQRSTRVSANCGFRLDFPALGIPGLATLASRAVLYPPTLPRYLVEIDDFGETPSLRIGRYLPTHHSKHVFRQSDLPEPPPSSFKDMTNRTA